MPFQRVYQSGVKKAETPQNTSQLAPRPFVVQKKKASGMPSTQRDIQNQAFEQDKFEATGLEIKHKHGTITPVEQGRLGVLQAKMNDFWSQQMEQASGLNYNFANIPLRRPDTSAPAQMLQLSANDTNLQKKGEETQTAKNLPASESLTSDFQSQNLMGGTKPWRRGKPNAELQKVFNALNAYHRYLKSDPVIGPKDFNVDLQVEVLQQALAIVVEEVNRYCTKHTNGKKTPQIQKLESLATEFRKKIFTIGANPQYLGQEWKQVLLQSSALQQVEQEIVTEVDSEEKAEADTDTLTDSLDLEDQEKKPDALPDEMDEMSDSSALFEAADSVKKDDTSGFSAALSPNQKYNIKEGNFPQQSFAEDEFGNIAKIEPRKSKVSDESKKATPPLQEEFEGNVSNRQLTKKSNLEEDSPTPSDKAKYRGEISVNLKIYPSKISEDKFLAPNVDNQLGEKYSKIKNEYQQYRALVEQFFLTGGRTVDYFTKNPDAVEGYISSDILPHLDQLDKHCDEYLTRLKQLEPNILKSIKKQNRELRKKIKITSKHINEEIKAKIPEAKQAAISYVKTSVETRVKEAQTRLEYKNKFAKDKKAIKVGVQSLDSDLAEAIKETNQKLKRGGEVTKTTGNLSGAYLVPNGFFKPLSQSPGRESQGLKQGYQAIREVLAYEISKYINSVFQTIGSQQNIGIAKTSFASLKSEEFAYGGNQWNATMKQKYKANNVPEAQMPEQIGIWQERLDIKNHYEHASEDQKQNDSDKMRSQVQQVAFFDLMTGNYDRHQNNLVFDKAGNLRPVDQGEILPNFDLYKAHNRQNNVDICNPVGQKLNKNNASQQLIWSDMKASEAEFSEDFRTLANNIVPDQVITFLKQKTNEISQKIGMPELTKDAISEESWQIMHLHILALKKGIEVGLSPKELAQIFGKSTNGIDIGELYQTFVDLKQNSDLKKQDSQTSSELTPEEFDKAKKNVLEAINNGKKRLRPEKKS